MVTMVILVLCSLLHLAATSNCSTLDTSNSSNVLSCGKGYENNCGKCKACDEGKYKFTQGDEECIECPDNSNSYSPGAVSCECISGYYRANNENITVKCTGPPSAPPLIYTTDTNIMFVVINWLTPIDNGGRDDLSYRVTYTNGSFTVSPVFDMLIGTDCNITGLTPSTQYTISVISVNGVSDQDPNTASRTVTITVVTNGPGSNKRTIELYIAIPVTLFLMFLLALITTCLIICCTNHGKTSHLHDYRHNITNEQQHKTFNVESTATVEPVVNGRYETIIDDIYYVADSDLHPAQNSIYEEIGKETPVLAGVNDNREYLEVLSCNPHLNQVIPKNSDNVTDESCEHV